MKTAAPGGTRRAKGAGRPELVKMSELASRCDVPAATIKHYIREGLVPAPSVRTSRNMAYYDAALVPRIRAIKEVQRTQFLPLKLIKEAIDGAPDETSDLVARCLERGLEKLGSHERRTREQLIATGMPPAQLEYFDGRGILSPERGPTGDVTYAGDDLALLRTLGRARRAGISPEMLPHTILAPYVRAIGDLVRVELELFRSGMVPRSGENLPELVEHAAKLSEQLIVLLRRRMILPMLAQLSREDGAPKKARPPTGRRRRPTA